MRETDRHERLEMEFPMPILPALMQLVLAFVVWTFFAVLLGVGMVLAVKGSLWLLALGALLFTVLFIRYGCLPE